MSLTVSADVYTLLQSSTFATFRTAMGLGTGDSPTFAGLTSPTLASAGALTLSTGGGGNFAVTGGASGALNINNAIGSRLLWGSNSITIDASATSVIGLLGLQAYTVATLPAGSVGKMAYVTDATTPTYNGALVGGGAVRIPVFHNGTAWVSA